MTSFQQFKLYSTVVMTKQSGSLEREWWVTSTRQEAEQDARQRIERDNQTVSVTITRVPVLVENSPKRAYISGLIQGTNMTDIETLGDGPNEVMATWARDTGWLIRDERSKSRRIDGPDLDPSEC
jgi:hypothetical protein